MFICVALLSLFLAAGARPAIEGWPPCSDPVFDTQGHRGARAYRPENTLEGSGYDQ